MELPAKVSYVSLFATKLCKTGPLSTRAPSLQQLWNFFNVIPSDVPEILPITCDASKLRLYGIILWLTEELSVRMLHNSHCQSLPVFKENIKNDISSRQHFFARTKAFKKRSIKNGSRSYSKKIYICHMSLPYFMVSCLSQWSPKSFMLACLFQIFQVQYSPSQLPTTFGPCSGWSFGCRSLLRTTRRWTFFGRHLYEEEMLLSQNVSKRLLSMKGLSFIKIPFRYLIRWGPKNIKSTSFWYFPSGSTYDLSDVWCM